MSFDTDIDMSLTQSSCKVGLCEFLSHFKTKMRKVKILREKVIQNLHAWCSILMNYCAKPHKTFANCLLKLFFSPLFMAYVIATSNILSLLFLFLDTPTCLPAHPQYLVDNHRDRSQFLFYCILWVGLPYI